MANSENEAGQALILALALISMALTLFLGLFSLSMAVKEKIHLQNTADLAVLTALNVQANALNAIAMGNRAILSNEAVAAQANALVSEAAFYRQLMERFSRVLKALPSSGPILGELLIRGGKALEILARQGAGILTPYASACNGLLETERKLIMKSLPLISLRVAREVTGGNSPRSSITGLSRALLAKQVYDLSNSLSPLDEETMRRILRETLDPRTLRRNWVIGAGSLPFSVRKTGGSKVLDSDFYAYDRLSIRTLKRFRLRWQTVISASSRACDFGYRSHRELTDLYGDTSRTGLTLMLKSGPPPVAPGLAVAKRPALALSSGELFYHRTARPDESPNLLNPFWRTRLIPVATEKTAEKLIPHLLLKEIKH